jgi:hypothetical protein
MIRRACSFFGWHVWVELPPYGGAPEQQLAVATIAGDTPR